MNRIASWLDLPPGHLPTIRRAVGLLLLCVLPEVVFWSHGGPGPYHVPAWRIGGVSVDIPLPPPSLDAALWGIYVVAAGAMLLDFRSRAVPAVAAAILGYYGWRDARACNSSYVQLLFTYLVAFLFARGPVHGTRRLIQCSLTACYAFSVLQKLAMPEWRQGHTLDDILRYGDGVRAIWAPLLRQLAPPAGLVRLLAPGVILVEVFIAGGLWARRTRKAAFALGIALHAGFTLIFHGVDLFAPAMLTGYLAFPDSGEEVPPGPPPRRLEVVLAAAYLAFLIAVPARIYLPPMRPWHLLTHMDHLPWTYSMFAQMDHVDSVEVAYLDRDGSRRVVAPVGRMLEASSDADLHALAREVLREHPDAGEVEVRVRLTVNHRRGLEKLVRAIRGRPPSTIVRECP